MSMAAWRWAAGLLLLALGLARGAGGVLLLLRGPLTAGAGVQSDAPLRLIAGGLVLVGVLCAVAGVLVLRRSALAPTAGFAGLVLFVLGGIANGTLLYGNPRPAGVLGNLAYAAVTGVALWWGGRR